jgi:hypothetical protein
MHRAIALTSLAGAVFCSYQITCPQLDPAVYEIEFTGKTGTKFTGHYQWTDPTGAKSMRIEKVEGVLPHKVAFSPPGGSHVSAYAFPSTLENGAVTTVISRDGVECTEPLLQGSGIMNIVQCPL